LWRSSHVRKIGIYVGSYGGFKTLMAIGRTPAFWAAAAVDEYGIINGSSMLKSSDPSLNEYLKGAFGKS
jgi:dipeptidyl aminopeptidase/acylaminoacyl peptidase